MINEIFSSKYKIWMIHEVNESDLNFLKKIPSEFNIFVWDDGVISQFFIIKELLNYKNVLAVSSNVANFATNQLKNNTPILYESTHESHIKWHSNKDARAFMTWDHIKILKDLGVYIAAHGYNHDRINHDIKIGFKELMNDCDNILKDFYINLNFYPNLYVYPYNDKTSWSDIVLKKYNMKSIGPGRINYNKNFKCTK